MKEMNEHIICPGCEQVLRLFVESSNGGFVVYSELCEHKLELYEKLGILNR